MGRPLGQAVRVLERVAERDLTQRLEIDTKDEVGHMARALNRAVDEVHRALSDVQKVAVDLAAASNELSASAESMSSGSQEQAASLEETASSLEEIASAVKQNAESAHQATTMARTSREVAEKGGHVVQSAMSAMVEISRSSKKIGDIIGAIDEIAFQTNLLAINAAVEAARAGGDGRGFADVAAEIRSLAQRSAAAAKEIKGLIGDAVKKVDVGSEEISATAQTLKARAQQLEELALKFVLSTAAVQQARREAEIPREFRRAA